MSILGVGTKGHVLHIGCLVEVRESVCDDEYVISTATNEEEGECRCSSRLDVYRRLRRGRQMREKSTTSYSSRS